MTELTTQVVISDEFSENNPKAAYEVMQQAYTAAFVRLGKLMELDVPKVITVRRKQRPFQPSPDFGTQYMFVITIEEVLDGE
jgi:hypothetical protein